MTDPESNDALPEPTPAPTASADIPAAAETPPVDTPAPGTPGPETPTVTAPGADAAPTVEAPAAASTGETPAAAAATATAPAAAVPVAAATPPPARPSHLHVPIWVAAVVGALVIFALGLGIGYAVGDRHDGGNRSVQAGPGFGFGNDRDQTPFGNNGGSGRAPFGGNGNGNGSGRSGNSTSATVFLGVAAQDSSDPSGAALVRVVAGSPAADAGLKTGDVITKLDGTAISGSADLTQAVHAQKAGDTVTITYVRDGQTDTTQATLAGSSDFSRQ